MSVERAENMGLCLFLVTQLDSYKVMDVPLLTSVALEALFLRDHKNNKLKFPFAQTV